MKSFRLSLFPNSYKTAENQPDARGNLQIPLSVINELYQGVSMGTIVPKAGYGDSEHYVELRSAAWKSDGSLTANGKQRPAISITIDSPAETASFEASKAAKEATSEFPQPQRQPQPVAAGYQAQPAAAGVAPGFAWPAAPGAVQAQQPQPQMQPQAAFNDSMPF